MTTDQPLLIKTQEDLKFRAPGVDTMWGKESCRQGARTWLMENEIDSSIYPSHKRFGSI